MLQQDQRASCLTAPHPQRTLQDHCHCILRTFTLFKDKCIVNFLSPYTRYVWCSTPPTARGGFTSTRCTTHYKWNQMSFSVVQNYLTLHGAAAHLDFRLQCRALQVKRAMEERNVSLYFSYLQCRVHVIMRRDSPSVPIWYCYISNYMFGAK